MALTIGELQHTKYLSQCPGFDRAGHIQLQIYSYGHSRTATLPIWHHTHPGAVVDTQNSKSTALYY